MAAGFSDDILTEPWAKPWHNPCQDTSSCSGFISGFMDARVPLILWDSLQGYRESQTFFLREKSIF